MVKTLLDIGAASSEFVSSSILSWQIWTAHAQPFRGARDLAFCLKVPLDSLLVWASSEGSGVTARMRRLAWTFAARIGQLPRIFQSSIFFRFLKVEKSHDDVYSEYIEGHEFDFTLQCTETLRLCEHLSISQKLLKYFWNNVNLPNHP